MQIGDLSNERITINIPIAAGQSISAGVDLGGFEITGAFVQANWTAATLSLEGSVDNVFYGPIQFGAAQYGFGNQTGAFAIIMGNTADVVVQAMLTPRFIRLRSGTSAAPVNQTNLTSATLILAPARTQKP